MELSQIKEKFTYLAAILLVIISSFISIIFCFYIAEKFFFDKFFYQKSVLHGYYPNLKPVDNSLFGSRSLGIRSLENHQPLFSPDDSTKYKVLIIGDSFVWGVGIQNNQRFSTLLQKKLNQIRPTKVVSLSSPGWNSIEFLKYYKEATKNLSPDLTIFSLVHNDSLISKYDRDNETLQKCRSLYPNVTPVINIDLNQMIAENTSFDQVDKIFNRLHDDSWTNSINLCILDSNLANLPTDKAIYFLTDNYGGNSLYTAYSDNLKKYGKHILSGSSGKEISKYNYLWDSGINTYKLLSVSHKESHPNSLANQMYADILTKEITSNQLWKFKTSK